MKNSDTHPMPRELVDELWDYVDQFTCPITRIARDDERDPPGDHHGTGWLISRGGEPHLCTCEHVAKFEDEGVLGYAPFGGDSGISVGSKFDRYKHPVDFASANIQKTWLMVQHQGRCISPEMIAEIHAPVPGEFLYVHGFPGADSRPAFSQHNVKALGVLAHEVEAPDELASEEPPFDPSRNLCIGWNTYQAVPLTRDSGILSAPGGMSGSALWNTRYREVTEAGGEWSVSDIKVTAIIWGASYKASVMVGTAIEHFRRHVFV